MKHILFLTSTNLASNPRCAKEVELALQMGFEVTVFAFDMSNWTREVEQQIVNRLSGLNYNALQTSRKPLLPWLLNSLLGKGAKILYRLGWHSAFISAVTTDKRTLSLLWALKRKCPTYNLIIAHNPGAFYPAWWLSSKTGTPLGIDIEDFHPGENNEPVVKKSVTTTMRAILPHAQYLSVASPMILDATLSMDKKLNLANTFVINNVFATREFPDHKQADDLQNEKLRLLWFSQHISFDRGLDEILPLLDSHAKQIQLTLIGNLDPDFNEKILKKYSFIEVKQPMTQEMLNGQLGRYDIGLALESNKTDDNRKICLTNKIWAYLQAGLYIWANNTPAQERFAREYPTHTKLIDLTNKETIQKIIVEAIDNLPEIRKGKSSRYQINQEVCWENESRKLIQHWKNLLEN